MNVGPAVAAAESVASSLGLVAEDERDGHVVTLWTYHEPSPREIAPADYAGALRRLHAGRLTGAVAVPHFTDRVEQAQRLVGDRGRTPDLAAGDRDLLASTLRRLRAAAAGSPPHGLPGSVPIADGSLTFVDVGGGSVHTLY